MSVCKSCGVGRVTRGLWCEECDVEEKRDAEFERAMKWTPKAPAKPPKAEPEQVAKIIKNMRNGRRK